MLKKTKVLALGREQLKDILGDQVSKIIIKNQTRWAIQRHETLSKLTKLQQEKILSSIEFLDINTSDLILDIEDPQYSLILLITGTVVSERSKSPVLKKGDCYLLLPKHELKLFKENLIGYSKGQIGFLKKNQINEILKADIEKVIADNVNSHEVLLFYSECTHGL